MRHHGEWESRGMDCTMTPSVADRTAMVSIVIPTYGREDVLLDTVRALLGLTCRAGEILLVDQTADHEAATSRQLQDWEKSGKIQWIRRRPPCIVGAMNHGAEAANGTIVLFLDDDIIPGPDLIKAHADAHHADVGAWAVVGRVIQPEDRGTETTVTKRPGEPELSLADDQEMRTTSWAPLLSGLKFAFNGTESRWVTNVMAGNLSVKRDRFLAAGGFDRNFVPPVAYRFETEFARRVLARGGAIRFEPSASIQHLRASHGGTRSRGGHLASASPIHGVGDYYYALRCGRGWDRVRYICRRPFREVRTRFHLRHPWYIPVKLIGEGRAMFKAWRLYRAGPKLIARS